MQISVICPVYNEAKHIGELISFFTSTLPVDKELYLIDGGSTDGTIKIIQDKIKAFPNIVLLSNTEKYVSFALNKTIPLCKGLYIARLDAHTNYASDYFEKVIKTFQETDADIVGGPMRAVGQTSFQKAVANATSTSFGIGNSDFHFENFKGYTESVYLGAWKNSIFAITGMFDEELIRNQDDEFHYRARSKGLKIFQDPEIKSYYFPRESAGRLFNQYFQYGLYKPMVLRKVKSSTKIRHLIPSLFVLYLIFMFPISSVIGVLAFLPLILYTVMAMFFSFKEFSPLRQSGFVMVSYFVIHVSYGLGFLSGLFKHKK